MDESYEIIATLSPSPVRRVLAIGFIGALGLLCIALAILRPPADPAWTIVLFALGAAALWLSRRLALATRGRLELTSAGLREAGGRVLAPLDSIVAVERGAFAFKPSSGFLVRLSDPGPRAWAPGLWWRLGRRIGVGGVTPSAQGRLMADSLAALIAARGSDRKG